MPYLIWKLEWVSHFWRAIVVLITFNLTWFTASCTQRRFHWIFSVIPQRSTKVFTVKISVIMQAEMILLCLKEASKNSKNVKRRILLLGTTSLRYNFTLIYMLISIKCILNAIVWFNEFHIWYIFSNKLIWSLLCTNNFITAH